MMTVEVQAEVLALFYSDKRSVRWIAKKLGICRRTVGRIVNRRTVKSDAPQRGAYQSILDPYKLEVDRILERDLSCPAPAILNRLRECGYTGGITVIRDYLRKKRQTLVRPRQAFLRLEFAAGEAAQVDWGEFGDVFGDGIKIHCFAMVLAHSRLIHIEFTRSEKFEDFIRGHEEAFKFFGGVPRECWYDNLGSAVTERLGQLIKFNARFMAYMGHHHIRPHACNVARGNEKGRVEDLIKYIRLNFWPARTFKDFDDLNRQAREWRDEIANKREHRSTRRIPRLHFDQDERPVLMERNPHGYDTDEIISKVVPPDFHILYETNRYSVPWTLTGIAVTVRIDARSIRVYYDNQPVTSHERSYLKHRVFTKLEHQNGLFDRKPGATRDAWQVSAVKSIGPRMHEYVDLLRSGERSLRLELAKILALSTVYGEAKVYAAALGLLERSIIGVASLEVALKAHHHPSTSNLNLKPIKFENQKLNRVVPAVDLRRYDALCFESIKTNQSAPKERSDDERGTTESGNG